MMQRNNRQKQEGKLKKDDKKQKQTPAEEESSGTSISAGSISKKQQTASATENISEVVETTSSKPCSSRQTESQNQSSLLGKRRLPSSNEIIGYVESVSPSKRNRRDTTDYCDVVLQVEGPKKRRAVCFSSAKRQLLLEKKNNKTAVKISKYSLAKDSETIYINDMTYISKPRPEEYAFQYEESFASVSDKWLSLRGNGTL